MPTIDRATKVTLYIIGGFVAFFLFACVFPGAAFFIIILLLLLIFFFCIRGLVESILEENNDE